VIALSLSMASAAACQLFDRGPADTDVVAAVRKKPPAPPTLGPTYLSEIGSVEVEERGRYNASGRYWPLRVRIKGMVKVDPRTALLLAPLTDPRKHPATPVEFVEEVRLSKDDFGKWQASYHYADDGPRWRRSDREAHPGLPSVPRP